MEKVCELLATGQVPGSANERRILCIRIAELVALNGEAWVRRNRARLLEDWAFVVAEGMIAPEESEEGSSRKHETGKKRRK